MTPTAKVTSRLRLSTRKLVPLYAVLISANLAAWAWALIAFRH